MIASESNVSATLAARSGDAMPASRTVAGIGGTHSARPVLTVERQSVSARAHRTRMHVRKLPRRRSAMRVHRAAVLVDRLERRRVVPRLSRPHRRTPESHTAQSAVRPACHPHETPSRASPSTLAEPDPSRFGVSYETNPSRVDRRCCAIQSSAASTCGHSLVDEIGMSPVRSKYACASITNSGVASALP